MCYINFSLAHGILYWVYCQTVAFKNLENKVSIIPFLRGVTLLLIRWQLLSSDSSKYWKKNQRGSFFFIHLWTIGNKEQGNLFT